MRKQTVLRVLVIILIALAGAAAIFAVARRPGDKDKIDRPTQTRRIGVGGDIKNRPFTYEEIVKMTDSRAVIETKFGNIEIKFFPDIAPNHVENFITLANKGFYDGTTFHRVVPGFMIQGGDPNSKSPDRSRHGMGGPGHNVKAEFSGRTHKRGVLSMARGGHPDSAGSQFFICVADSPFLDRQYSVFGEVVSGMDAADKIVSMKRDANDNPLERAEMKVKIIEGK